MLDTQCQRIGALTNRWLVSKTPKLEPYTKENILHVSGLFSHRQQLPLEYTGSHTSLPPPPTFFRIYMKRKETLHLRVFVFFFFLFEPGILLEDLHEGTNFNPFNNTKLCFIIFLLCGELKMRPRKIEEIYKQE